MYSTPTQPRTRHSSLQTPIQHSAAESRRALGQASASRTGETPRAGPLGKVLAREGLSGASPRSRMVRKESWTAKARDAPSNFVMNLQTSLSLLSLDPLAYPAALACHALHAITRLPTFAAALPNLRDYISFSGRSRSRFAAEGDADARLEALRRAAEDVGKGGRGWVASLLVTISVLLILVSVANAAYLFTRKRRYHLILRPDPLASPNAKSTKINFAPPRPPPSYATQLKTKLLSSLPFYSYFHKEVPSEVKEFTVQQLDLWTPDHVKWSVTLFALHPPPVAVLWQFVTPSNFVLSAVVGAAVVGQTWLVVHLYAGLVRDKQILQSEVMHEYNAKFVNPRIFVQKADASTSTSDLDITQDPSYVPRLTAAAVSAHNGTPRSAAARRLSKQPSMGHLAAEADRPAGWTPPGRRRRVTMGPGEGQGE